MEATAKMKHMRQSAKKVRFVLSTVKALNVNDALNRLSFTNKKAAKFIEKTILSAVANINQKEEKFNVEDLYIKNAYVDEGPTIKRFRPAAMGRATRIRKRTSHLTIIVSDRKN